MYVPGRRVRRWMAAGLVFCGVTLAVFVHAQHRRGIDASNRSAVRGVVSTLGFADLALSSSARWLRHPSQVEEVAPFQDLPASLDVDPAGALQGPPRAPRFPPALPDSSEAE